MACLTKKCKQVSSIGTLPMFIMGLSVVALSSTTQGDVFFDDFSDGNRDGWYNTHGDRVITVVDNQLVLPGVQWNTHAGGFLTYFDATTLDVGEVITLSFGVNSKSVNNANSGFRFGLLNSRNSQISEDVAEASGTVFNGYTGYAAFQSIGSSEQNQYLYQRVNENDTLWTVAAFERGATEAIAYDVPANEFVEMSLSVFRKDATTAIITSTINGLSMTWEQSDVAEFAFDTIGMNLTSQTNGERVFSYFSVEVVPEPGSMMLLGLGGLLLTRRRTR